MEIGCFKNVLVLAPHTDDGELGAGGTIAKLIDNGAKVTYVAFSIAEESLQAGLPKDTLKIELLKATSKLGIQSENVITLNFAVRKFSYKRQEILEELIRLRNSSNFDLVFLPSINDIHQDHHTIAAEGVRAYKGTTVLGYELVWNNLQFNSNVLIKLSDSHVEKKINALKEYQSQSSRAYMQEDFIRSLARVRGTQVSCKYAEAFEAIRLIIT